MKKILVMLCVFMFCFYLFSITTYNKSGFLTSYKDVTMLGIKNDGSDVTVAINALPSGNYYFPEGEYGIDGEDYQGFKTKSNSNYYFEKNAKIKILTNDYSHYAGILIRNCDNVNIFNPTIEGDRLTHKFTSDCTNEWGHGIIISDGCGKINIKNPYIYDVIGDGINFICPGSDVTINNLKVERARRQGMSIEDVGKLTISGGLIQDIFGTSPQAGINIEPYKMGQHLENVVINDVITKNTHQGLLFANLHMADGYNITINNSIFDGIYVCNSKKTLAGEININNPIINGSNVGLYWTNAYVKMNINNPIFMVDSLKNEGTREGIFRFCELDKKNGDNIGGLTCINAHILNSQSESKEARIFNFCNSPKSTISDINISVAKSNMTNTIWATTPSTLKNIKLSEPRNKNVTVGLK